MGAEKIKKQLKTHAKNRQGRLSNDLLLRKTKNTVRKTSHRWYSPKAKGYIEPGPYFIAAQVSAGFSAAAVVTAKGKIVKISLQPTKIYRTGIFQEMSTNDIWKSLVVCIKRITENLDLKEVKGIGMVAVPALVCLDQTGNSITASVNRDPNINCILASDIRSILETETINQTHHARLQYFGERTFHDLVESKMLWLKHNLLEDCWHKVGHLMDLPDFLTWKATGSFVRSSSVLLSNWSYEATVSGEEGWNSGFFNEIGLPEMVQDKFKKLGTDVQRPGQPIENGLLDKVAKEMGLPAGLPVATSLPEAHAGALGIIGCQVDEFDNDSTTRMCIIFDHQSSAHLTVSHDPIFMKGMTGPMKDGILPGLWLNRGGQPTAEGVMNFVIGRHPAEAHIKKHLGKNMHIHKYLNKILKVKALQYKLSARSFLTKDYHILPDFDGNQSPLRDPRIRGMVSGLTLKSSQESLALSYLATMQSLAYSTRHIISAITEQRHTIKSIIIGGGLGKNTLFVYLHRDICQQPVISPDEPRCKLIGAAILGGVASKHFRNFYEAINAMCGKGRVLMPDVAKELAEYHNRKFQVFLKMYEHQLEYRRIMSSNDNEDKQIINM